MSSEVIDGQKIYFYNLLLVRGVFEDGQKQMLKDGVMADRLDFMKSGFS